jgi:hypothetical protein
MSYTLTRRPIVVPVSRPVIFDKNPIMNATGTSGQQLGRIQGKKRMNISKLRIPVPVSRASRRKSMGGRDSLTNRTI